MKFFRIRVLSCNIFNGVLHPCYNSSKFGTGDVSGPSNNDASKVGAGDSRCSKKSLSKPDVDSDNKMDTGEATDSELVENTITSTSSAAGNSTTATKQENARVRIT